MTWKTILKIDMKEARRLGETYAPEDMDDARRASISATMKKTLPRMEELVGRIENTTDGLIRRNAMQMLRQLGNKVGLRLSPIKDPRTFLMHVKAFIKNNKRYME
tara:strand:+ start:405 stop:719 length:315 start_codon:yes stop_codon:yes gene_type:complete